MFRVNKNLLAVSLCATLSPLVASHAVAYEQGDLILRAGAANVNPAEDSDTIDVAGLATLEGAGVEGNTQLGLTFGYMATSNIAVELLLATPFTHDIDVEGTNISAGEATQLPPTLTVQYHFASPSAKFQPYLGAGINYTVFFDEEIDGELNAALDGIVSLPPGTVDADLELDNSLGLALHAGCDFEIAKDWMLNASIWMIDIDTEATIKTAVADVSFDVEIDPFVYMVGLAHKF